MSEEKTIYLKEQTKLYEKGQKIFGENGYTLNERRFFAPDSQGQIWESLTYIKTDEEPKEKIDFTANPLHCLYKKINKSNERVD